MTNHDITLHPDEALNGNLEDCARLLFPQKGESKPRLRFRGFEGEWSRKMIGTIGMTYSGLSGKGKNDFGHGDAKYITFLNVLNNVQIDCSRFEKVEIREGENQNKVHKGDLLFNTSSETPEEVAMCAVMGEEIDNLYLNSFCFGFRLVVPDVDPLFLAYQMRSPYGRSLMSFIAQGATRYNLPKKEFVKTEIIIPKDIEEQRQIASFLCHLDEQIAVKQRQLERLKQMKLACFGSLFPDNQSITPPLRFKGFSGEWETVLIKDAFDVRNGYTPSKYNDKYWTNGTIPWFRIEDIRDKGGILKDAYQKVTPLAVKGSGLFKKNSIIMSTSATIGVHAMLGVDSLANQRFTNFTIRKSLEDSFDPYFIYYAFFKMDEWAMNNTNSGGLLAVDIPGLLMLPFPKPSLSEQRLISSFLLNLDTQIDSLDKMLLGLMQMKKACLNQMIA